MHLLVLFAQHHWTGPAEPVLQIARGLRERGHRITWIYTRVPPGHLAPRIAEAGLGELPEIAFRRKGFHPVSWWRDRRRLRRFIREQRVDLVFCHHSHDHWFGREILRGLADPPVLVRQIHESRQLRPQAAYRFLYRRTDALIVASQRWKQALLDRFGIDASRVFVLPPAVDTARFKPVPEASAIRAEIGAAFAQPLIGLVSRIKTGRGHELALEAFGLVSREHPGARLLFVGRGEGRAELEERVRQSALAERVHFLGYRSDDLPAVYAALNVSLLLGEGSDGSCRAALEAMACGTPVVALPVGTLPESLIDGVTGRFVEGTVASLAAGIRDVLAHPEMGEAARRHAESALAITRRVARAEEIFLELTGIRGV
ncbi:MAG: glycosyltransferase family 4 protein [Myxococcales bacterium]|nr:glycosyltransferase family 4 protein [Myxococcales bacterium]